MAQTPVTLEKHEKRFYRGALLALLGALLVIRIVTLVLSPAGLQGDEAQYWFWSRDFDWGYFSKPPMIAWVIALSTSIFGNAEWGVRMAAPILHVLTAGMIFLIARRIYNAASGYWAAALYITMPAVWLGSFIISTDTPLLLFWSMSLFALIRLRETPSWRWALMLGAAIGLGCLTKYAMLFFALAVLFLLLFDRTSRKALLSRYGIAAAVLAALILAPNLFWNMQNGMATITHTAANADIENAGMQLHERIANFGTFWLSQFGVFGLISFGALLVVLFQAARGQLSDKSRLVSLFVIAPLIVISVQSLISGANANWAAGAYVAGSILVGHFLTQIADAWRRAAFTLNVLLGIVMCAGLILPDMTDRLGMTNPVKRTRAWPATVDVLNQYAKAGHEGQDYDAIALDHRLSFFNTTFYGLPETHQVKMWLLKPEARNHAEAVAPLPDNSDGPYLIASYYLDHEDELKDDFGRLELVDTVEIPLGGDKVRTYRLWAGYDYKQVAR